MNASSRAGQRVVLVVVCLLLQARLMHADDVIVMTSGAFAAAHLALAPGFKRATKDRVVTAATSTGVGTEAISARLGRGEPADVIILPAEALDDLIKKGLVVAGSR